MNYTIHRYESVGSTNDIAIRMAGEGASEGTVVVAGEQMAGRGRHGRTWTSPPGCGLYLSIILRPERPWEQLWQTAFVASLATAEAIRHITGLRAQIKWPNDILINGRKVSGILIESRSVAGDDSPRPVVVGIGINVNTPSFPIELSHKATSLYLESGSQGMLDLSALETTLLEFIDVWYAQYIDEGFEPILEAWRDLDCTSGRRVDVHTSNGIVSGTAVMVNSGGDMVVECTDGRMESISAGEVFFTI